MFENIGRKLKILAQVICWVGIIVSVLSALLFFFAAGLLPASERVTAIVSGGIALVLGPLLSWIGSFQLYAYGELVEKTTVIEQRLKQIEKSQTEEPFAPQYEHTIW